MKHPAQLGLLTAGALAVTVMGPNAADHTALAQEVASGEAVVLDAITVEARRREEQLIDIPVAATVIDEGQLDQERVTDSEDLARRVPSFVLSTFGDDPRSAVPIIRGVGALSTVLSPDNSTVPTLVDGAPLPAFAAAGQLLDVEQVELLRGPQGTLFGRNSTAGAINVRPVVPDGTPERTLIGEVGTDFFRRVELRAGDALGESLFGRVALRYTGQNGYTDNLQPGEGDFGGFDIGAARASLRWLPSEATDVRFSANLDIDTRDSGHSLLLRDSDAFQGQPFFRRVLAGGTANVDHDFDAMRLSSVTSFQVYDNDLDGDANDGLLFGALLGLPPEFFIDDGDFNSDAEREYQGYQEFRLSSLPQSELGWVVGAVVSYNDFNGTYDRTTSLFPTSAGDRDVTLQSQSYAAFADISVPFLERFEVATGFRYTREIKEIDHTYVGTGAPGVVDFFEQESRRTFDLFAGRVSLSYEPTDDSLLYVSVSRGAKAGGFSRFTNNAALGIAEDGFDDTRVWAVEGGAKAELFDRRVSVSLAGFFNDIRDEALLIFDPTTFTFPIENLDLRTYGVEFDATALLPYGFDITGAVAWTETEITDFDPDAGIVTEEGNRVSLVPRMAGSVTLNYVGAPADFGLDGDFDVTASVGYRFTGARPAEVSNTFELDPQHVLDARLGVAMGPLELYAFGENLIGDELEQQGNQIAPGIRNVLISRGRTVGVGVSMRF